MARAARLPRMQVPAPMRRGLAESSETLITANGLAMIAARLGHYARPQKAYTAATWADEHRVLPAGGRYTRWATSRTPYMFEVAEVMASAAPEHRHIVISKSSQIGFTALSLNEMLRLIDTAPTSILYFRETQDKIEEWRRTMLAPSLRLPPFNDRRDIKILGDEVYFPGGYIIARGTGSSNAVAGTTARVIIGDEVAKFAESLEGEGDFFSLATQRSATFKEDNKAILFSTPKERSENEGSFYQLVQRGDVRRYSTPCRHCEAQWFWEPEHIVRAVVDGEEVFSLRCPECGGLTHDGAERVDAMQAGRWVPTKEPRPGFVSFEVSGMLSWRSLKDIYHALEDATSGRAAMAAFENTIAGRFYDPPEARRATPHEVMQVMTRQVYRSDGPDGPVVPNGCCVLTMAVDVQGGQNARLEWEVRGWGPAMENWSICRGELGHSIDETQACMIGLKEIMGRDYKREDGRLMKVRMGAIDIGFRQDAVKAVVRFFPRVNYDGTRVFIPPGTLVGVKGHRQKVNPRLLMATPAAPLATGGRRRQWWLTLGVDVAKTELYRAVKTPHDSDEVVFGRAHAPVDYPDAYWDQIVAEEVIHQRNPKDGRTETFFRPQEGRANEALDLWVYSRACVALMRAEEFSEKEWATRKEMECKEPPKDSTKARPAGGAGGLSIQERRALLREKRARQRARAEAKRQGR